ncbi:MAG: peroxiredoxin [Candidatus Shikimatogenerans bostrichidophilus]|nr:MAG: peroxiredoxin [Candidatus Shikimatogenerans bostrichidophilus]WGH28103.1 MAG: peroxiredoxin [Candidatus Shikimatogenerans bostrichidophilus]
MINLIGKKAPNFNTNGVKNNKIIKNFSLKKFYKKNYIILIFYPKDFSYICTTELYSFQDEIEEFNNRNVKLIAISTDSEYSHLTWLKIKKNGGIMGINYYILSDINKTISYNYGVLSGTLKIKNNNLKVKGELIPYRGLFFIDKLSIIRHQLINDIHISRNIYEVLRIIDSWQYYEKNGELLPANFKKNNLII